MQKIILALAVLMGISSFAKAAVISEEVPYPNVDMKMFLALTLDDQQGPPEYIAETAYSRAGMVCNFLGKPNVSGKAIVLPAYAANIELVDAQLKEKLLVVIKGNRTFLDQYDYAKLFSSITCAAKVED